MSSEATMQRDRVARAPAYGLVRAWLLFVALLVLAMVVVGGATRLTDSGLSITEWKPILGAIPPLTDADWQVAFAKYKEIPEYKIVNKGMSLSDFKVIYWWEWGHRFLGRIIGLAFALPLAFFWMTGRLRHGLAPKLLGLLALGGLQGFVGWYMVQSGLVERVDVSQYRLALHLTIAFAILALLVWLALDLGRDDGAIRFRTLSGGQWMNAHVLLALLFVQVVLGAFVAGTKAGLVYNTWPLMDGRLLPEGMAHLSPWYLNLTENLGVIQLNHRLLAYVLLALALWQAASIARSADDDGLVRSALVLAAGTLVQAGLGIATLLGAQGGIPIGLGLFHQGGAAALLAIAVWHLHAVRRAGAA